MLLTLVAHLATVSAIPDTALPQTGRPCSRLRAVWSSDVKLFFLASALVLVPCFWQSRIQAGDLSSHLYNAWLAQLIKHSDIQGLRIAHQWNNVLFDVSLEWLLTHVGIKLAEPVAVALSVLSFFWGSLILLWTVSNKRFWFLAPCIAMLAYGYVFQMGFFNFYISLGFSFFGLALLWRGASKRCLLAIPLLLLAWTAHPLPVLWCLTSAAYKWIASMVPPRAQCIVFSVSVMCVFVLRYLLFNLPHRWSWGQLAFLTGADQVVVYGNQYFILSIWLLFLWGTLYRLGWQKESQVLFSVPLQLMLLSGLGTFLLPDALFISAYNAPLNFLMARMSIVTAVLACCVTGAIAPAKFHRYGFGVLAVAFFAVLFADQRALNKVEDKFDQVVQALPHGERVIAAVSYPAARVQSSHMLDRACIGHCFSYANYEPSTGQFRIRATSQNNVVAWNDSDSKDLQNGRYVVRAHDLPLYQIYSCGPQNSDLCVRSLHAGETNGAQAVAASLAR